MSKFLIKVLPTDEEGVDGQVSFLLGNGQKLSVLIPDLPQPIIQRAAIHGLSQKIGDSVAGLSKTNAYGNAFNTMQAVIDALYAGRWNVGREGASTSDLVTALARLKKLPIEDVKAAVNRADEDTLKIWSSNPAVKKEVQAIRLERAKEAAKGIDVSDIDLGIE